jgi:hypothetical protein
MRSPNSAAAAAAVARKTRRREVITVVLYELNSLQTFSSRFFYKLKNQAFTMEDSSSLGMALPPRSNRYVYSAQLQIDSTDYRAIKSYFKCAARLQIVGHKEPHL